MEKTDLLLVASPEDGEFKADLKRHLYPLEWQGLFAYLDDLDLAAGQEPDPAARERLGKADLVLLLVGPASLATGFFQGEAIAPALARFEQHRCAVFAVILRPCDWKSAPLTRLDILPERGRPVTDWPDREQAFANITAGVRRALEKIDTRRQADARRAAAFDPQIVEEPQVPERNEPEATPLAPERKPKKGWIGFGLIAFTLIFFLLLGY